MGAEAILDLLQRVDLDKLSYELRDSANTEGAQQRKNEALKRLQVVESFRASQKIWAKKTAGFHAKVKSELYAILYHMQEEYSMPYSRSELIRPAIDFIHANYDKQPISVEELAHLCGVSTVHLRNTFIKVFASSPVRYINSLKITRAKELLRSGMYSASQVCFLAGFRDESHFSREFKKNVGKSPKEYAKSSQE